LVPIVRATTTKPAMASKKTTTRASTSQDDATKAALTEKKGKAALVDDTLQVVAENVEAGVINTKQPRIKDPPTPEGTIRMCSSEDPPRDHVPPGFTHVEALDVMEEGKVLGISTEDQLKL
jgi:hypothetical protein